ncbi:MAG: hypothetical protein HRU20_15200 [Pseudomonadales bacterium]|nr:hypothetical protein [Pseudomonadales bacterium]
MSIIEDLDKIMSIQLVKTDGLPTKVISSLDGLLDAYRPDEILAAMMNIKATYTEAELNARKSMGASGMGAEFHMAAALRLHYLKESVTYIECVNKRRQ